MKGTVLWLGVAALATAVPARAQEPIDHAMVARIRAEGLERSQVLQTFNVLTNVMGPRLTGTPAYTRSAQWSRAKLAEWGLSSARLEAFPFGRGWTLEKLTLEMTTPRYFPLVGYPQAWTPATRGVVTGRPVYIGEKSAAELQAMGEQLRGAIVLGSRPQAAFLLKDRVQPADHDEPVRIGSPQFPPVTSATAANAQNGMLQRAGAAVVLRPSATQHGTLFALGSRNTSDDAVPTVILAAEHYNMLVRLVEAGEPVDLRIELGVRYHTADTSSYNVIAELPGQDPVLRDEVVMIGAHLDSWHSSTGGTDNADGAAVALEAMRILQALGVRPRRTIRVALWGGEEQGLLGARAWAEQHLAGDANASAREKLSVYLNDDPGSGATYGFYMENNAAAKAIFDAWLEPLKDLGARRNVIGAIGSTDHLAFTAHGVPGFTAIKDYLDYDVRSRHSNTDFFERVSEADLKQSSIVLAAFAYHAAMRAERIPRSPVQ